MKYTQIVFGLLLLVTNACNTPAEKVKADQPITEQISTPKTEVFADLNPLPEQEWMKFMTSCSSLDITFYSLNFSISVNSCAQIVPFIERSVPKQLESEEFGHILFLINGEKFSIAQIILSEKNNYLKFELDGKQYYHNLTESGAAYFKNIQGQIESQSGAS